MGVDDKTPSGGNMKELSYMSLLLAENCLSSVKSAAVYMGENKGLSSMD